MWCLTVLYFLFLFCITVLHCSISVSLFVNRMHAVVFVEPHRFRTVTIRRWMLLCCKILSCYQQCPIERLLIWRGLSCYQQYLIECLLTCKILSTVPRSMLVNLQDTLLLSTVPHRMLVDLKFILCYQQYPIECLLACRILSCYQQGSRE